MRIDRNLLSSWIVFVAGIVTCFGRWRADFFPKSIFAIVLVFCIIGTIIAFHRHFIINCTFFLSWYGLFFLFVLYSLLWTANSIDPEVIIVRILFVLAIGIVIAQNVYSKDTFKSFLKGLIFGGIVTLLVTLYIEREVLGIYRIGAKVSGSENVFGSIMVTGLIASLILNIQNKKRIYLFYGLMCFLGSALSGSRLPLIFSLLAFLIFLFFKANLLVEKIKFLFISSIVIGVSIFLVFNNTILYNAIGQRLELLVFALQYESEIDHSYNKRSTMKNEAIKLWQNSPIIGNGVNSFWILSPVTEGNATSHSGHTEILCSFGILGFALFYWPFFHSVLFLKNFSRRNNTIKSLLVIVFLIFITDWQEIYFQNASIVPFLAISFSVIRNPLKFLEAY